MRALVSWLHEAERHATRALARASGKRVQDISLLTLARRLGEGMLPDPARYEDSSLSPLAAGEPHLGEGVAGGFAGLVGAALSMHGDNSGWDGELPANHDLFVGGWSTPLAGRTSGPGEKSGGLKSRPAARLVGGTG
ncbi:MAG TPA: hypothetical protein VE975_07880 [Actinomycetota bacterium]|jgi:hypothetical protein|nr:hypothetical protein [Actinomycetota bacterium]